MNLPLLESQLAQLPICLYHFFSPKELEFSHRVRWVCSHECPMYGRSWACPPGVGTVEQCRDKCLSYDRCLLISTMTEVADISNLEITLATRQPHEEITNQVRDLLRGQGIEPYVLSTQACAFCEECTYCHGKPCRHPQLMHPCIESHSINLLPMIEQLGLEFQNGSNVVTWFSLLFYAE